MRSLTAALLIILAQPPPQLPPRFRTGIDVVELDVTVLDDNRRPVRGLMAADFTLLEDDRPQDVIAFQEIDVPPHDPAGAAWLRDVAPDVTSNEPAGGRILILVLDDATMPPNPMVVRTAKAIAREAIAQLGPQDRAAVLFTRDNSGSQDFTADRARLARAIDKLAFGFIRPGASVVEPSTRRPGLPTQARASREDALWYHYSIQTVRRAAEYLRDAPHRRKTLLYISVGVPIDFAPGATEGTVSSPDADVQRDLAYQAQRAFVEAVRSNVVIYGIDPAGLQVDDTRLTREFLQTISENTGGSAVVNTNAPAAEVAPILDQSGSYYLLGFQSTNQKDDGRFRRLQVRVNRPGVIVRARRGYYGPRRDATATRATPSTSPLDSAIGGLLPKGDLRMQVVVSPFAIPGKRDASLAIVTRFEQPPSSHPGEQSVELLTGLFDTEGRQKGGASQTVTLKRGARGNVASHYEILSKVDVKPGRYLVRVGAHHTALSTSGSVYADVDVPDFSKAALALSGVVLSGNAERPAQPKDALASLIPLVPTTRREFERNAKVTAFVRVYQDGRKSADSVAIAVRLIDAANREVFGRTETLTPESFLPDRAADYRLELPLADLTPGPHVLTIEARAGKSTARRDVRLQIR